MTYKLGVNSLLIATATLFVGSAASWAETVAGKDGDIAPQPPLQGKSGKSSSDSVKGELQDSSSSLKGGDGHSSIAPLEGGVQDSSIPPLQGGVVQRSSIAPLQGGVVQRSTIAPLQGGVVQRSSIAPLQSQSGVQDSSSVPLQGRVQDSRNPSLRGRVDENGNPQATLRPGIPNYAAIMRIVQYKQNDTTPPVVPAPPPLSQSEIEQARFRDAVNLDRVPVRANTDSGQPLRSNVNDEPPKHSLQIGRPQRTEIAMPQRSVVDIRYRPGSEQTLHFTADSDRPRRSYIEGYEPTNVEALPDILIRRPPTVEASIVLTQPLPTRALVPDRIEEVPAARLKKDKSPARSQELKEKKKQQKNELELASKAKPQPQVALTAQIDESLLWDQWYQHINDLVCNALTKTMPNHGNPAGTNRIHITVWPDHRLEARLVQGSNAKFNAAILEAYSSLNGSSDLEFPRGTRRKQNDYETAHIQEIPAVTASFDSKTIHGDMETLVK